MTSHLPSVVDQIAASMTVGSLQHQVIASNIANRDAHGYQRMKVQFDQAMDRASAPVVTIDGSDAHVSIEQDLMALSANSMRYQELARVLSRYFSIVNAITNYSRG